jgi:hypothetical protein
MVGKKIAVQVWRVSEILDENSVAKKTFIRYRTIKGMIRNLRSEEIIMDQRLLSQNTHRFYCDNIPGVTLTVKDELRLNDTRYNITGINDLQGKGLQIDLLERK